MKGHPLSAVWRARLMMEREYYKEERLPHVTREVTDTSLTRIPSREIATHLVKRVLRRLKLYQRPITD